MCLRQADYKNGQDSVCPFCSSVGLLAALCTHNEMKTYCGVTNGKIQLWLRSIPVVILVSLLFCFRTLSQR